MDSKRIIAWICATVALLGALPAWADIVMGVFPRRSVVNTYHAFSPLAKQLEKELGEKVVLKIPKNFKAFWAGIKAKQYDIVHYNQYHYIKSHKDYGYRVILINEERGSRKLRGQISVRKDSGLKSVADLKGKTILFGGGPKAMGSYVAPVWILKKAGLTAGTDYRVRFAKNPPSAVIATYHKVGDASASGDIVLHIKGVTKHINTKEMQSLATSDSFIHLAWAVKKDFDESKARKVQAVMTALKNSDVGRRILKSARVTDFHVANDSDFGKVREMVEYALGEKY